MTKGATEKKTIDRKSTRLNSSHVRTSYAVFCLKKKTHCSTPGRSRYVSRAIYTVVRHRPGSPLFPYTTLFRSLNELYPAFLEVCIQNQLNFLSGDSRTKLQGDIEDLIKLQDNDERRNRKKDYSRYAKKLGQLPYEYQEHLLKFFTESPRSIKDIGIGFLAPISSVLEECYDDLKYEGININIKLLYQILVLLFWEFMDRKA